MNTAELSSNIRKATIDETRVAIKEEESWMWIWGQNLGVRLTPKKYGQQMETEKVPPKHGAL